jgi:hypothetical protein
METQLHERKKRKAKESRVIINIKNSKNERNLIERIVQTVSNWSVNVYDHGKLFWHAGPLLSFNLFYEDGKMLNKLPGMEVSCINRLCLIRSTLEKVLL